MRVFGEVSIAAEPAAVWARLLVWERQPEWMVDAISVRVVSPRREGTGVRIAVRTKVLGLPLLTDTLEVTEWEPPRRLAMVRKGFVRGRGEWVVAPAGTGARFRWIEELSLPIPLLGELALHVYRPVMRRLMRRSLENLAHLFGGS